MTEQTYFRKRDLPAFNRAVRAILQERLTETQYRRVALRYGFDGEPLSERQAGAVEGCGRPRVQRSREAALRKLRSNAELWFLWLMADGGLDDGDRGADLYVERMTDLVRSMGRKTQLLRAKDGYDGNGRRNRTVPIFGPEQVGTAVDYPDDWGDGSGWHTLDLNPGADGWESDAYNPAPDEIEAYGDGWIACHEYVSREDNPYAVQNRRGRRADPTRREWADRMENAWRRGWLDARRKIRDEAKATA